MKIIAKNSGGQYMAMLTKLEILQIAFGITNADYNKDTSKDAEELVKKCNDGEAVIEISKGLTNAQDFINKELNSDGYDTIKTKLKSILEGLETMEAVRKDLVKPYLNTENEQTEN
jgi:hypothetical protein